MITVQEQIALHEQTAAALRAAGVDEFTRQLQKSTDGVTWEDVSFIAWGAMEHYRISEKILTPWPIRAVPLAAWFRRIDPIQNLVESRLVCRSVISGTIYLGGQEFGFTTEYLAKHFEHSVDNGETWLPCGIES